MNQSTQLLLCDHWDPSQHQLVTFDPARPAMLTFHGGPVLNLCREDLPTLIAFLQGCEGQMLPSLPATP